MIARSDASRNLDAGRWLTLAACSLGFLVSNMHRISPGVYASELMRDFDTSASVLGLLSSSYFYTYGLLQIPIGYLCDRFRPGRVIGYSMMLAVIGSIAFGLSKSLSQAMISRIVLTCGVASVFIAGVRILGYAFRDGGFSIATGVMVAAGSIGGVAALAPLALFVERFGWRASMHATAALTFAVALLILLSSGKYGPVSMGSSKSRGEPGFSLAQGRKDYILMLAGLSFAILLQYGSLMGFQGLWGVPFVMDVYGFSKVAAGKILTFASIGAVLGSALSGWLVDSKKASPHALMLWSGSVMLLSWIPLAVKLGSNQAFALSAASFLLGGSSVFTAILNPTCVNLFIDDSSKGRFFGILNASSMVGAAAFQPAMGLLIDNSVKSGAGLEAGYFTSFRFALVSCVAVLAIRVAMYYRYRNLKC